MTQTKTVTGLRPQPHSHNDGSNGSSSAPDGQLIYSSTQLFGSAREISIRHEDSVYRLRITRQRKLILNK